jgi:hypothetical protein
LANPRREQGGTRRPHRHPVLHFTRIRHCSQWNPAGKEHGKASSLPHIYTARFGVEIFGSWAPVISLFKKFKNHIYRFQKNMKIISNVDNDLSHKRAKYKFQILCILATQKRQVRGSGYVYFQISNLIGFFHFYVYKKLHIENLHALNLHC